MRGNNDVVRGCLDCVVVAPSYGGYWERFQEKNFCGLKLFPARNVCTHVIACDKREAFAQGSASDEAIQTGFAVYGLRRLRSQ
jgi:hypothetical protein